VAIAIAVRVRFFARLRDLTGVELEGVQLSTAATIADLYEALRREHPNLPERGSVRGAINQEFAEWGSQVSDGDEVAFIPPVSGGF
jgi:MoaE-MoaD fusion protein